MSKIRARALVCKTFTMLVVMIAAAGCGPKTQSGPAAPQPPAAQAPQPTQVAPPAQPSTQPAAPAPAQPAPATPAAPPPASTAQPGAPPAATAVAAKADGEVPGTRVEMQDLKRSTNTLMLRFTIFNDSQKSLDLGKLCATVGVTVDSRTVCSVNLVDAVGKKKYLTIHDSEGRCVCSGDLPAYGLAAGDSINLWAKFPAPPDSAQKISVVIPGFIPMDDVPISQ